MTSKNMHSSGHGVFCGLLILNFRSGSLLLDFPGFSALVQSLTLMPSLSCAIPSSQADERYRKNIQGSPQTAPPPKQPPLPPRSSEPFSNGGSSEASAMHRPMEPQVTPSSLVLFLFLVLPHLPHCWMCVLTQRVKQQ